MASSVLRAPCLAVVVLAAVVVAVGPEARADERGCRETSATRLWFSSSSPVAGSPLRILAVSEDVQQATIRVSAEKGKGRGKTESLPTSVRGGPPFSFAATLPGPGAGTIRVELVKDGRAVACRHVAVVAKRSAPAARVDVPGAWRTTQEWNRATENFFSAWIERMFDAPPEESLSFPSLAPVLHDPARNFLWGYLGLREDDPANRQIPRAVPDCADLPYYLRAYFAWKMGLPFALRDCDRGKSDRAPTCGPILHNEQADESIKGAGPLERFRSFLRVLANRVHSGSARTALDDNETDFYPVALTRNALRPGTIFADPYGHVLMVAAWLPQTAEHGGLLLAVDGQPDNSVGRKRFWEGTFLYANDVASAGPGFKAFRPVVHGPGNTFVQLPNSALAKDERFAPFSTEQARLDRDAFYARIAKVVNPAGLDARAAYTETMNALVEQLTTRVGSVDNGEHYMREKQAPVVPMPTGAKIFETTGPWEDYATPSRDMRLLIALRVLTSLPERITTHPELFVLGGRQTADVRAEIEALHTKEIQTRAIDYRRSDGSTFRLTVAEILNRRAAFEMAYNPNDCVEIRWGASPGTPDFATCQRHAPDEQRARMDEYRSWFHEAKRPAR